MAIRCTKLHCGYLIEPRIVELGRVVYDCPQCARKKARLCRDCPARTSSSRHWRCTSCGKKHRRAWERVRDRDRYKRRRAQVLAKHEEYRRDPTIRAYRKQYMADYRKRNPRDHHDRAYGREYMRQMRADPAYREREKRRKRQLRRLRKQEAA